MKRFLSAVSLFLMSSWAFAASKEMEAASAPAETVDVIYVVIFVVIFIASIVGFFVYLFLNEKKQKSDH